MKVHTQGIQNAKISEDEKINAILIPFGVWLQESDKYNHDSNGNLLRD